MSTAQLTQDASNSDTFLLTGELNADAVSCLCQQANLLFKQARVTVDLAGVARSDSVGLALLTDWLREAKKQARQIKFINPPAQMLAMAKVCGLELIFGF